MPRVSPPSWTWLHCASCCDLKPKPERPPSPGLRRLWPVFGFQSAQPSGISAPQRSHKVGKTALAEAQAKEDGGPGTWRRSHTGARRGRGRAGALSADSQRPQGPQMPPKKRCPLLFSPNRLDTRFSVRTFRARWFSWESRVRPDLSLAG